MIKHPAKYYILYLLSKRSLGPQEIVDKLSKLGFPLPLTDSQILLFAGSISAEARDLVFPPGYNPRGYKKHKPTEEFLRQNNILDLWTKDPYVLSAIKVLKTPNLRRMLEVMLLGPLRYEDISNRAIQRFGLGRKEMNARVVREFAHYFWNYDALNRGEWLEILRSWYPQISEYGDTTSMELQASFNAPRNTAGAALTLWLADSGAGEPMKETTMFKLTRDISFWGFMQQAFNGRPMTESKSKSLQALLDSTIRSQEQLDQRRGGSAEVLEELRRFETIYDSGKLTAINEIPLRISPALTAGAIVKDAEIVEEPKEESVI